MDLRRELFLTIGALILLNLLLAFGVIGLFVRMGPAIERILQENVFSIVAGEEILAEFAAAGGAPLAADARIRVHRALANAKRNVTEQDEPPVLAALERSLAAAANGDADARRQTVRSVGRLIRINRSAMSSVDAEARRLGGAGAWAAVIVGFLSFLLSILLVIRLQKRLVRPLLNLYQVLEATRQGDRFRRCRLADAPREVIQVTQSVNQLLDERLGPSTAHS